MDFISLKDYNRAEWKANKTKTFIWSRLSPDQKDKWGEAYKKACYLIRRSREEAEYVKEVTVQSMFDHCALEVNRKLKTSYDQYNYTIKHLIEVIKDVPLFK